MADTTLLQLIDPEDPPFEFKFDFKLLPRSPEEVERQMLFYKEMWAIPMEPIIDKQKPPYKHPFLNTDTFD